MKNVAFTAGLLVAGLMFTAQASAREGHALVQTKPQFTDARGQYGQRLLENAPSDSENETYVDRDIMVIANPEIAGLPNWVIGLIAAGAVAAALSTAAGLLLVISSSISHDLLKSTFMPSITDKQELLAARLAAATAIVIAGWFGIHPPAFVAQVVAFAFGMAAASLFPAIVLGIFSRRISKEGAIAGMLAGLVFTVIYIVYFVFINPQHNNADFWLWGISTSGIGALGAALNVLVSLSVSAISQSPPQPVISLLARIRLP